MRWKAADGNMGIKGKILAIEPMKMVQYSFTTQKDIVTLTLEEGDNGTLLSVTHGDFAKKPDGEACYRGADAGWDMNLEKIKELAEMG